MARPNPYLVIEFTEHPAEGVNTSVKGWMDDPKNIQIMERAYVEDRIGKKQNSAAIIIDLINGTVMKKTVNKPDDVLVSHYIARYEKMIHQALVAWSRREATLLLKEEMVKSRSQSE